MASESEVSTREATILKLEVEIHPGFHRILVNPRNDTPESLAALDDLYHAILSSQPKRGKYVVGTSGFVVDVKSADTDTVSG